MPVKKSYSFTGDLKIYETCPRQYQFFREYNFTPSRSSAIFFGLLVHQTIEEIHRIALDGQLDSLNESRIREIFEVTFRFLALTDKRSIGDTAKEGAFRQVINYYRQNSEEIRQVVETEVDVSLEKDGYILIGKIDLVMGKDGKFELLDFKTSPRPKDSPELIAAYERQLCTYAHILERRHKRTVDRLMLYWTSEPEKEKARMILPYDPKRVEEAGRHFDETVRRIQERKFEIPKPPEAVICDECDLRMLFQTEGVITREVRS
jgi:DNA helicase-2/ATP-dependent DNA helicase PcrA